MRQGTTRCPPWIALLKSLTARSRRPCSRTLQASEGEDGSDRMTAFAAHRACCSLHHHAPSHRRRQCQRRLHCARRVGSLPFRHVVHVRRAHQITGGAVVPAGSRGTGRGRRPFANAHRAKKDATGSSLSLPNAHQKARSTVGVTYSAFWHSGLTANIADLPPNPSLQRTPHGRSPVRCR